MSDRIEIQSLKRKIRRLENKLAEVEAEAGLNEMMAHDLAGPSIVEYIGRKYPAIAKKWAAA